MICTIHASVETKLSTNVYSSTRRLLSDCSVYMSCVEDLFRVTDIVGVKYDYDTYSLAITRPLFTSFVYFVSRPTKGERVTQPRVWEARAIPHERTLVCAASG